MKNLKNFMVLLFACALTLVINFPVYAQKSVMTTDTTDWSYEEILANIPVLNNPNEKLKDIFSEETLLLEDTSYSMRHTFAWERDHMVYPFVDFSEMKGFQKGRNGTNLWETLNKYSPKNKVVITDFWDEDLEVLSSCNSDNLLFLVPYSTSFEEGVLHVHDRIQNVVLPNRSNSHIFVSYLDGYIFDYSTGEVSVPPKPNIEITLSDEESIERTSTNIGEEVEKDLSISRESVIVTDVSGSMYDYIGELFSTLQNKQIMDKMENAYLFSTTIIELSPQEITEESLKDAYSTLDGGTDIATSLQVVTKKYPSAHIYLITDLQDFDFENIKDVDFTGIISVYQYKDYFILNLNSSYLEIADDMFQSISNTYPNAEAIEKIAAN